MLHRNRAIFPLKPICFMLMAQAMLTNVPVWAESFGERETLARGVSADGRVVVGGASVNEGGDQAFRWDSGRRMQNLGTLGGEYSTARAASANGEVVVGWSYYNASQDRRAFRWTSGGGMQNLGTLGGNNSLAFATSYDGSVVVGQAQDSSGITQAFRWTQASGMVPLGAGAAYGVSADGSVVVGNSKFNGLNPHAFRWVGGSMADLETLSGTDSSYANGVSANGQVVVGYAVNNEQSFQRAFRWANGTMSNLGSLGGSSEAFAASADGSVVVGQSGTTNNLVYRAFRWTAASGMKSVEEWLAAAGVQVAQSFATYDARSVSADGSVVVGNLQNNHAFIARVSPQGSGMIMLSDVQQGMNMSVQGVGGVALNTILVMVNGAHSNPLSSRIVDGQKAFWVAGDWGRDDHGRHDGHLGLAELGMAYKFGPAQFNLSLGQNWSRQNLEQSGHVHADGSYLLAEALLPLNETLWSTFSAYGQLGKLDIKRAYMNAGQPDASIGRPDMRSWGLRARVDWEQAWRFGDTHFAPYTDLTYGETRLDDYTEKHGGFPAHYERQKYRATELRLGINAAKPLDNGLNLVGMLEAAHRFEKTGPSSSGQLIGLFDFKLDGQKYDRDWLRAGFGIEGKLAGGRASIMLNATTRGEVPDYWMAARWQASF